MRRGRGRSTNALKYSIKSDPLCVSDMAETPIPRRDESVEQAAALGASNAGEKAQKQTAHLSSPAEVRGPAMAISLEDAQPKLEPTVPLRAEKMQLAVYGLCRTQSPTGRLINSVLGGKADQTSGDRSGKEPTRFR